MSNSPLLPSREDFAEFIVSHSAQVTPADVTDLLARLPELREKVAALEAPGFPRAAAQLGFLTDIVESFAAERLPQMPYSVASEAIFGLLYLDRAIDLIPDSVGPLGYTDDAAVAATVLLRNPKHFAAAAHAQGLDWSRVAPAE